MRYLLFALIVLFGLMLDAEAARRSPFHGTDYTLVGNQAELLDCKYGVANVGLGPGRCFRGAGRMPLPEFLYVKWRDRTTGTVYEERVDLRHRLPSPRKMEGSTVYWLIEDNQLYIYLAPDEGNEYRPRNRRSPDQQLSGCQDPVPRQCSPQGARTDPTKRSSN